MTAKQLLILWAASGFLVTSASATIVTLPDFTRSANAGVVDVTYDFDPNDGWSGSPPNAISGESPMYLAFTVGWDSTPTIGFFDVQLNRGDDGGAGRWSARTEGAGFAFFTANANGDPDGIGPATAKPTVDAFDTSANTSVTLVLKVDQVKALTNPGGDYWYGDIGKQDDAAGFLYINPNLTATEASQPTKWAAWRSSNESYQGVSFLTDTAGVDLRFTDIAIYTGGDTPFSIVPEPATVTLLGLGLVGLLLRRRRG